MIGSSAGVGSLDQVPLNSIYCDASGQSLGCVLMQDGYVVAYASRQLRKHEEKYLTHNLELAVMVHALKIWRHYIIGKRCEVYSDHKSLKYIWIREWKWEEISMDFIVGLPKTQSGYDSIWVIIDRLSKVAHFIPVKTTYKGSKLAELYIARIVCLHGVPKKIVSHRGR
jgi:hypothetical protein